MSASETPHAVASISKRRAWRWRFSLRTLFVCMTLICILLGTIYWRIERVWNQQRLKELIQQFGSCTYDYEIQEDGQPRLIVFGPRSSVITERYPWLAWLGKDFFHDIVEVRINSLQLFSEDGSPVVATPSEKSPSNLEILKCLQKLSHLKLLEMNVDESNSVAAQICLANLASRFSLQELELNFEGDYECKLSDVLQDYHSLKKLHLRFSPADSHHWKFLGNMARLESLDLQVNRPSIGVVSNLPRNNQICRLRLAPTLDLEEDLEPLRRLSHLISLTLSGDLSHLDTTVLGSLKKLQELECGACQFNDETCEIIATLPELETLYFSANQITDRGIGKLVRCKRLNSLTLWGEPFTGEHWENAAFFNQLETLYIDGCPLTASGLNRIYQIPNLASLTLLRLDLKDSDFQDIKKIPQSLKTIQFNSVPISGQTIEFHLANSSCVSIESWMTQMSLSDYSNLTAAYYNRLFDPELARKEAVTKPRSRDDNWD